MGVTDGFCDIVQTRCIFERQIGLNIIAKGLPASPGAASGLAVFDADTAEKLGKDVSEISFCEYKPPLGII